MTPIHPHLLMDRDLTEEEMMEALAYEGMFAISTPGDIATAEALEEEGLLSIGMVHEQKVVIANGEDD